MVRIQCGKFSAVKVMKLNRLIYRFQVEENRKEYFSLPEPLPMRVPPMPGHLGLQLRPEVAGLLRRRVLARRVLHVPAELVVVQRVLGDAHVVAGVAPEAVKFLRVVGAQVPRQALPGVGLEGADGAGQLAGLVVVVISHVIRVLGSFILGFFVGTQVIIIWFFLLLDSVLLSRMLVLEMPIQRVFRLRDHGTVRAWEFPSFPHRLVDMLRVQILHVEIELVLKLGHVGAVLARKPRARGLGSLEWRFRRMLP